MRHVLTVLVQIFARSVRGMESGRPPATPRTLTLGNWTRGLDTKNIYRSLTLRPIDTRSYLELLGYENLLHVSMQNRIGEGARVGAGVQ